MKRIALTLSVLLMSVAAMSQTYSNANLNGNYVYRLGTPVLHLVEDLRLPQQLFHHVHARGHRRHHLCRLGCRRL